MRVAIKLWKLELLVFLVACCCMPNLVTAAALLDNELTVEGYTLFQDHDLPHVYHLAPKTPVIALDELGRPEIFLSLTYYVGTELRGGTEQDSAYWSFLVKLERPGLEAGVRDRIIGSLQALNKSNRQIVLRDLAIRSVPARVEYTPISQPQNQIQMEQGSVVAGTEPVNQSAPGSSSYWTKRNISFPLSPEDGLVVRAALEEGGAVISISSSFDILGVATGDDLQDIEFVPVQKQFNSDALRVQISPEHLDHHLRVLDLNSVSPPGFVGLTVLCYDFLDNPEEAQLSLKKVYLEAEGVTGRPIKTSLLFPTSDEEASMQYAEFPFAVRVDRPYRFKIKHYDRAGNATVSDWQQVRSWVEPLDVSSYPTEELREEPQ